MPRKQSSANEKVGLNWTGLGWSVIVATVLVAAIVAVYSRAIDAPFFFDDHDSVTRNSTIVVLSPLSTPLSPPRNSTTAGRPLVNLSFAVNYYFGKLDPRGYHVFNLFVHALSACLLWSILRRVLRLPFFTDRFQRVAEPLALAISLLWAIHPLNTESVAYVTQRTELMMAAFYLTVLYASLRYWQTDDRTARGIWLAIAVLAAFGGMASKEVMVSAPLMMLLFDRTFISGSFRKALAQNWPLYVGLASSSAPLIALNVGGPRSNTAGFHTEITPYTWWLTQSRILFVYLKLVFWPWPLVAHYGYPYLYTLAEAWPWVSLAAGLAILSLALFWRGKAAGFVGAFVFAVLAPTLVVPIDTEVVAERRMYLPLAAIVALMVAGAYEIARRLALRGAPAPGPAPAGKAICLAILLPTIIVASGFATMSRLRLGLYDNPLNLWDDAIEKYPDNYFAQDALAQALMEQNRYDEAAEYLQRALRIKPDFDFSNYHLGVLLMNTGQRDAAIQQFRKTLSYNPDTAVAQWQLGLLLYQAGNRPEGMEHLERSLELSPNSGRSQCDLADMYSGDGLVIESVPHYLKAIEIYPDMAPAHVGLGQALARLGRLNESIPYLQSAIAIDPRLFPAQFQLAAVLFALGRFSEAADHFAEAVRLEPANGGAWLGLARCNVALNRYGEATKAAERALSAARAINAADLVAECERLLAECREKATGRQKSSPIP